MILLLKWIISACSILIAAYLIPGVRISGIWTAVILAAILGLLNISIKPLLLFFTLPINILTVGLFTFVINALIILLASTMVKGFEVGGFFNAFIFGIVLSVIETLFEMMIKN